MANLLPIIKKRSIVRYYRLRVFAVALAMCAVVMLIALSLLAPSFYLVQEKLNSLTIDEEGAPSVEKELYVNSKRVIDEAQEKVALLENQYSLQKVSTDIVDMVMSHKGDDVSIASFSYTRVGGNTEVYGRVIIEGIAKDRKSLTQFELRLKSERLISNVSNPVEGLAAKTNLPFRITVEILVGNDADHG